MKVLIVLHGLDVGGAQQMVYELIQEIDREDIELLCYGGRQNTLIEKETEKKVHVTYLNEKGKATIKKTLRILRSIKKINPDVVHAHLGGVFYSLIWAYIFRGRLVVTAHAKPEKAFSRMIEPWLKKLLKNNRIQIVTVSEENCALMQKYLGYTDHRIQYVNNGVCIRRFYREPHVGFTYINVARHDENKNQEAIIRCFRKIHELNNDTRLILLGDGPMHNKLKELVDQYTLGDCVQLPGMVSDTAKY